ncbi:MAG TPA: substrate-binding domain-containing protein [Dehalococcoidia bacterium]|nr:substrate-binding domain-containing protein [Dehalococcoidia bacterium]
MRPRSLALVGVIAALGLVAAACGGGDDSELLLATTTSTDNSGLLDELVPIFEERTSINVKVIAVGTGAALWMAEEGNADALLVHAPDAEKALLERGDVFNRQLVAYNDFIVVGPIDDPASIGGERDVEAALLRIEETASRFVSRGDDSGTHKKELALWGRAGVEPGGDWYEESGQGMGASLTIADQKNAYILSDRGTFLALRGAVDLVVLSQGDPELINLYSVMQVNPEKGRINDGAAAEWVAFLLEAETQDRIEEFRREEFGRSLFIPTRGRDEIETIALFASGEGG